MLRALPAFPVVLALLLLGACHRDQAPPQQAPPPEVGVIEARSANLPLTRDIGGRLAAYRSADVRARVPGVLQRRVYTEGSDVKQGDVLFLIDPAPLQAALGSAQGSLAQAQANYANAKASADRARRLAPTEFISRSDLDNALATERSAAAAVAAARAAVQAARINLGYATVRAPISGRAGEQQVTEGALVGEGTATLLTTVDQIDPLYANFSMGVAELEQIRKIRAAAAPGTESTVDVLLGDGSVYGHTGTLDFSGDIVDPATGAISLRALIPNPERRLMPGTYVTLRARLGQLDGVFAIPQAAVQRDAKGPYLMLVGSDGKVARRDVTLDSSALGGDWIVTSGLNAGEQVIVSGLQKVREGVQVTTVPWSPDASGQAPPPGQGQTSNPARGGGRAVPAGAQAPDAPGDQAPPARGGGRDRSPAQPSGQTAPAGGETQGQPPAGGLAMVPDSRRAGTPAANASARG